MEKPVYEGIGFAGVEFEDTLSRVEEVLGEPTGGCERSREYRDSRMRVCFCGGHVSTFHFYQGFRGKLFASGLGIGDTLADVMDAYGEVVARREVDNLCHWRLDRTLLILREGTAPTDDAVAKVCYYASGVLFLFDDANRVCQFDLFRKTRFLDDTVEGVSAP